MEFYVIIFIVAFLSSLLGNWIGEKWFGDGNEMTLNMTFHVDSKDIDVKKIADEITDEIKKTQNYTD